MSHVDAIYSKGVFKPLEPVKLREDQRVRLSFESTGNESPKDWLERVKEHRAAIRKRQGHLPDSAPDIAADRMR